MMKFAAGLSMARVASWQRFAVPPSCMPQRRSRPRYGLSSARRQIPQTPGWRTALASMHPSHSNNFPKHGMVLPGRTGPEQRGGSETVTSSEKETH